MSVNQYAGAIPRCLIGHGEQRVSKIVVITGAGAGVGRATVGEFARHGYDIALLSRDSGRLEEAAAEARACGVRALPISTDVADAEAVEAAATRVEEELGPIDVWVNVAMATVFSPVAKLTAKEVARGTAVTYLGQVHGMMAALRRMTPRNRGINRQCGLGPRLPIGAASVGVLWRQVRHSWIHQFLAIGNLAR